MAICPKMRNIMPQRIGRAFLEGRIGELSYKLTHSDIIDPEKQPKDRAVFASKLLLENVESGEEVTYQLVGPDESDIDKGNNLH